MPGYWSIGTGWWYWSFNQYQYHIYGKYIWPWHIFKALGFGNESIGCCGWWHPGGKLIWHWSYSAWQPACCLYYGEIGDIVLIVIKLDVLHHPNCTITYIVLQTWSSIQDLSVFVASWVTANHYSWTAKCIRKMPIYIFLQCMYSQMLNTRLQDVISGLDGNGYRLKRIKSSSWWSSSSNKDDWRLSSKEVLSTDRVKVLGSKTATRGSRVSRKSAYSEVRRRLGEIQKMSRCSNAII